MISKLTNRLLLLRDRIRLHELYQKVFGTSEGQIVLRHIMKVANITKPCHVAGDPYSSAFREGQRHLALSILRFYTRDHGELQKQVETAMLEDREE